MYRLPPVQDVQERTERCWWQRRSCPAALMVDERKKVVERTTNVNDSSIPPPPLASAHRVDHFLRFTYGLADMDTGVACTNDESVPLKSALAILAVQRRRLDRELARVQERYEDQKAESIRLQSNLETLIDQKDPYIALLSTVADGDGGPLTDGLTPLMTALRIWTATAQATPHHQSILQSLWDYGMRVRLFPVPDGPPVPETPIRAILTVLTSMVCRAKEETLLHQLTACLTDALMLLDTTYHDVEYGDGSGDFEATEDFISWVLAIAGGLPELAYPPQASSHLENAWWSSWCNIIHKDQSVNIRENRQKIAEAIVNELQTSPGTGMVVLGCTGQILERAFGMLSSLATGKFKQPKDNTDKVDGQRICQHHWIVEGSDENELVARCLFLTGLLQNSLRQFRDWTSSVITPSEEFLSTLTSRIWSINEMASVLAPMYPDIGRQGHRCASLLISVLQVLSNNN